MAWWKRHADRPAFFTERSTDIPDWGTRACGTRSKEHRVSCQLLLGHVGMHRCDTKAVRHLWDDA